MLEEYDTILNEIRLEWETILTDSYNPLSIALSVKNGIISRSKFRDMYFKLDSLMEIVINTNFKGFSDSVLSYNEFTNQNIKIISLLSECLTSTQFDSLDTNTDELAKVNLATEFYRDKYEILKKLKIIKSLFVNYQETPELIKKSNQIIKCLDLIDNAQLLKIRGVFEYRKIIYQEYLNLTEEVSFGVLKYIFNNEINNSFKCILILGALYELEGLVKTHFRNFLFSTLEDVIIKVSKSEPTLENLSNKIANKIDQIIDNYETVVNLVLGSFQLDKNKCDFFGNKEQPYEWLTLTDKGIDVIKKEIGKIVKLYSAHVSVDSEFLVENIVDSINYNKIYASSSDEIFKGGRSSVSVTQDKVKGGYDTKKEYTVIFTPRFEITTVLLKYIKSDDIKKYLRLKVRSDYTKFKIEHNKKRADMLFSSEIDIDRGKNGINILPEILSILADGSTQQYADEIRISLVDHLKRYTKKLREIIFLSKTVLADYDKVEVYTADKGITSNFEPKLKELLIKRPSIDKAEVLLEKKKYVIVGCYLNILKSLDERICNKEMLYLYDRWFDTIKKQLGLELIYYFNLFLCEGRVKCNFYIKKIITVIKIIYEETSQPKLFENLYEILQEYFMQKDDYIRKRFNISEIKEIIKQVKIFDEIMGEVENYDNLEILYSHYDKIISDK